MPLEPQTGNKTAVNSMTVPSISTYIPTHTYTYTYICTYICTGKMCEWSIQLTQELALPERDNEKDSHECRGSHSESIDLRYTYICRYGYTHTA